MFLIILTLCVSLGLLVWSADRFVGGAASLSCHFGIPPIVVGIVVIGFGTSAPELLISTLSAWQGNAGLAIGNAIGSNIANIGLILGITALITPLLVAPQTLKREFPVLILATLFAWWLLSDGELSHTDGIMLLALLLLTLVFLIYASMRAHEKVDLEGEVAEQSIAKAAFWTLAGLAVLLASSKLLVNSAVELAQIFGVSDLVIGLTIVAIGTSLPELAASITGALKHHADLAIGNVVGSNIFNTLGVVGIPGLIQAYTIPQEALQRDLPIMLFATLLVVALAIFTFRRKGMYRFSGILLLTCFLSFQFLIYSQSVHS